MCNDPCKCGANHFAPTIPDEQKTEIQERLLREIQRLSNEITTAEDDLGGELLTKAIDQEILKNLLQAIK